MIFTDLLKPQDDLQTIASKGKGDLQNTKNLKKKFLKIAYSFGFPNGFMGFPQSEHLYDLFEGNNGFHCNIGIRLNSKKGKFIKKNSAQNKEKIQILNFLRASGFPFF